MKLYTLDNIERDEDQEYLYDLFNTKISAKSYTKVFWYFVKEEESMRLDLICKHVYGNTDLLDEIVTLNNIVDPLSVTTGSEILMFYPEDAMSLYIQDIDMKKDMSLVNKNKETEKDPNREKNRQLLPNIKTDPNLKDINISNGKVKIVNNLK